MNFKNYYILVPVVLFFAFLLFVPAGAQAEIFNVDKNFDASARTQIQSVLVKTSPKIYFYVEKNWWDRQPQAKQNEVLGIFDLASNEFDAKIYPVLTSMFGSEWKLGVDGDARITVFFHAMNSAEGGYFREADEYIKLQIPVSNEREMVYLSLDSIDNANKLKILLAHELMHLIAFNQKNRNFDISDDTWLNEARADYSSTILGYDDNYSGSNLQARVKDFAQNPSDSVTEWLGQKYDYASVSLFTHYLVDHYGLGILMDSLKSEYVGVESINYALQRNGYKDDFAKIFSDWTIAVVMNNCSLQDKYCYLDKNLKNFKISPSLNFLPLTGNVSMSVSNVTKSWSGNWLKFIGGNGNLRMDFSSLKGLDFAVPYIIEDSAGITAVKFFELDSSEKGSIKLDKFGQDYRSITIMPLLELKSYRSEGFEPTYPFTYAVYVSGSEAVQENDVMARLQEQIKELKAQIAKLLAEKGKPSGQACSLVQNLALGSSGGQVSCLQEFLKAQGPQIYPEGLVTGYFGNLTARAVSRFQEKYAQEILSPLGLSSGTGVVGGKTRQKINSMGW